MGLQSSANVTLRREISFAINNNQLAYIQSMSEGHHCVNITCSQWNWKQLKLHGCRVSRLESNHWMWLNRGSQSICRLLSIGLHEKRCSEWVIIGYQKSICSIQNHSMLVVLWNCILILQSNQSILLPQHLSGSGR